MVNEGLLRIIKKMIEIRSDRLGLETEVYDISKIDFDWLRREFERSPAKRTTVQNLKTVIEQRLQRLLQRRRPAMRFDWQYGIFCGVNRAACQ